MFLRGLFTFLLSDLVELCANEKLPKVKKNKQSKDVVIFKMLDLVDVKIVILLYKVNKKNHAKIKI